ncbi:hypothetical protein [Candidatus Weimeria sp. HCP3S3_B5]|uniref:hypothetical protein n=1 Tax=Candidatus Weimeria sp. HCP3S3_B5 TaxID=3438871 RepID=UPI003F8BD158
MRTTLHHETFIKQLYEPGAICEFDWGEVKLDIFHYLRTLKKKPGALPHSCALMQADILVKKIYESYYSSNPKSFLEVMELIRDIGADKVQELITELLKTSVHDLSAEKLRMLYRNQTTDSGTDYGQRDQRR